MDEKILQQLSTISAKFETLAQQVIEQKNTNTELEEQYNTLKKDNDRLKELLSAKQMELDTLLKAFQAERITWKNAEEEKRRHSEHIRSQVEKFVQDIDNSLELLLKKD